MNLKVILHNKTLFEDNAKSITFKNEKTSTGILDNHIPIILIGKKGFLKITLINGNLIYIAYQNGIFKFKQNKAILLASLGVVSETKENALNELDKIYYDLKNKSKKDTTDFTKLEKDLIDNIKFSKAGKI